ncbi:hypothetical protein F5Y04DRAFT_258430 [Hypomontagnella monticulosa]|nr:hypothetical protein F5Y04DRAFT_258430 [Hypomontagnella monticulosa]
MTKQLVSTSLGEGEPRIEVIDQPKDIVAGFDCACKTFGEQTQDAIWMAMNPEWNKTGPEGRQRAAARMVDQWRRITHDSRGNANTIYLKATVPYQGQRVVAGIAIWAQLSMVEGYGGRPSDDLRSDLDLDALYPGNEAEQRYLCQVYRSFLKRRVEVVQEKASSHPPSLMHLQLCVVDPAHQRKGIASKLVQWGLDEAQRRGGLEATTEASSMGRHVYARLGFNGEGEDIEYHVDTEFLSRDRPANLFMRTG